MSMKEKTHGAEVWSWMIEALTLNKELSAKFLDELLNKSPFGYDLLSSNAKERLALFALEDMLSKTNAAADAAQPNSSSNHIVVDVAEPAQDVLDRVLDMRESSCSIEGFLDSDRVRLNQYITQKKALFSKCVLEDEGNIVNHIDESYPLDEMLSTLACKRQRSKFTVKQLVDWFNSGELMPMHVLSNRSVNNIQTEHYESTIVCNTANISHEAEHDDYVDEEKNGGEDQTNSEMSPGIDTNHKKVDSAGNLETDSTTDNSCIKCHRGGQLLVCSCGVAVHEGCLGSSANVDSAGNFYCPFCSYSQVQIEHREIERRYARAKEKAEQSKALLIKYRIAEQQAKQKQHSKLTPRRMCISWTSEEAAKIKEGVKIYGAKWSKILEFGGVTFKKNRTAVDLKDKWRNMRAPQGKTQAKQVDLTLKC